MLYRRLRSCEFAWFPSYNLVQKGQGFEGYIMAVPKDNPDYGVPICYWLQSKLWGKYISVAVRRPELISQLKSIPRGLQAISLLKACSDNVM